MKILKQVKPLLLLPVFICLLQSCANNKAEQLCQAWRIENLKYTQEVPPALQPEIDRWVDEMSKSFTITYRADGTYTTVLKGQKLEGKWKLNWNSSSITSTAHDGTIKVFNIQELSANKFTFEAMEGGEKVIFEMIPIQ